MSKASPPLGVKVGIFTFVWYMWLDVWFQVLHTTGSVHIAIWETSIQESHRQRNCPGRVCVTHIKNSEKMSCQVINWINSRHTKPISSPTFHCLLSLLFSVLKLLKLILSTDLYIVLEMLTCTGIYCMYKWNSWLYFLRDLCTVTLNITETVTRWARD